jgi:hypothetical protein
MKPPEASYEWDVKNQEARSFKEGDKKELECMEGNTKRERQLSLLIGTSLQRTKKAAFHRAVYSQDCRVQGRILT